MYSCKDIKHTDELVKAWESLKDQSNSGANIPPSAYRFAFSDPEFLFRREARGIRFQLEMLKPDLEQDAFGVEHTIVVFGSARFLPKDVAKERLAEATSQANPEKIAQAEKTLSQAHYYEQARKFAHLVAESYQNLPRNERLYICTGGGPGIMEAANRGAREAGAQTIGLNIGLPHEQHSNPYVSPELNFKFHYFAARKMHFMMRAQALVAFPGGYGTLDELFEVLTLVQTRKAKPVPIVLFGKDYWSKLINFDFLVQEGTISPEDISLFYATDCYQEAWDFIKSNIK